MKSSCNRNVAVSRYGFMDKIKPDGRSDWLGAIGGAIVDRMEPRRLLVSTQILAMLQAFVFWALVYFESIQFWHIITLVLFLGTVNSVNQTARYSLINNLVPRDDLMNAIALNSSVSNLAKILGPSLGGVLISIIGVAGCLFVNAVSFSRSSAPW